MTIQVTPSTVSQSLVSPIALNRLSQFLTKVLPDALIPRTSLTCEVTIISAAADVNPDDTGPDMKSITKPEN